MYKYYSVIRPISIGTIPDCTIREVVNFNQRQYVEEIMRQAWGYFLTPDEIPEEKLQAYSLVSADAAVSKWQPVAEKISEFSKKAGDDMEPEDILSAETLRKSPGIWSDFPDQSIRRKLWCFSEKSIL